jgi:hypothetical protein
LFVRVFSFVELMGILSQFELVRVDAWNNNLKRLVASVALVILQVALVVLVVLVVLVAEGPAMGG